MSKRDEIRIDAYVLDTLMRDLVGHDRCPSAFVVYLMLWRRLAGTRADRVRLSHQAVSEATGLSKSAVQRGLALLARRELIVVDRAFATATPEYRLSIHWRD